MKLTFEGVDISTEEKFVSYIESLNKMIMKKNAVSEIKKELYDIPYLRKRYRNIVSKNEIDQFMAEHKCFESWQESVGQISDVCWKKLRQ